MLRRRLPKQLPELALELADAGLARVLGDDRLEHDVVDGDLVLAQAVPVALPRPEIATSDRDLLVDGVAVEGDDLHAVESGAGIVSATFAVAMKMTCDRSSSTSR